VNDKVNKLRFGQVNLLKRKRKWVNAVALPFNSKSYSTGNPSIDKEKNTIFCIQYAWFSWWN
jgi:hypothetical protein